MLWIMRLRRVPSRKLRPEGPAESRPGRKAGILMIKQCAPKARHSIKNIPRVIVDPMAVEQFEEFLLKILSFVMLMLMADIFNDRLLLRTADAECRISLLPGEPFPVRKGLPNPPRRIGFICIYQVGNSDGRWHRDVEVNMVRFTVNLYQLCMLGASYGTQIGMKTVCPLRLNQASALLGAPNHMQIHTKIFSCHVLINERGVKLVKKISAESAAPSALD